MSTFDLYAAYYDLLYRDKNYAAEALYVLELLQVAKERVNTILELGCGTGAHAMEFARQGISVYGIDLSRAMINLACERRLAAESGVADRLVFKQGDIRTCRLDRKFDAVVSLFHVVSYQTSDGDLRAAFDTARSHLRVGGDFVFDFWYGPAVLRDRPRHIVRTISDSHIEIIRKATPTMCPNLNRVDVRFDVDIASRTDGEVRTFSETHQMRYLFLPEIRLLLKHSGFEMISAQTWMTQQLLNDRTWYGCVVARAIAG